MIINETLRVDIKELEKRIAVDYTGNSEGSAEWGIKGIGYRWAEVIIFNAL